MEIEKKYFIVSILCTRGAGYAQFMASGIRVSGTKKNFQPTRDRVKAAQFSKLVAENMVEQLKTGWRLTARVEPALLVPLAPYAR